MKTIIITGPSGSGKSILTNKLAKVFDNVITIQTDSFYKDDIYIKLLSCIKHDIYDRKFSIKSKEIIETLNSYYNNTSVILYNYDFKIKKSTKSLQNSKTCNTNRILILEGIFAHRLELNYKQTINIICKEEKNICYQRRLKRDKKERGRKKEEIKKRFNSSWDLYYKNVDKYLKNNEVIEVNTEDKFSYEVLISKLQNIC